MFKSKARPKTKLEIEIDRTLDRLENHDPETKEYGALLEQITKLHRMMESEKPDSVSKDTLFKIGANILGILMIFHHEKVNIITTKAMPFVTKP